MYTWLFLFIYFKRSFLYVVLAFRLDFEDTKAFFENSFQGEDFQETLLECIQEPKGFCWACPFS